MIRPDDALLLAYTKLKTRRIRLLITIVVSGLLFSGLAGASFFFRGVLGGVEDFSKEGFGDRYIVSGSYQGSNTYTLMSDKATIDQAIAQNKDLVNRKKAEAKRLGIDYDASMDQQPFTEFDAPDGKHRILDPSHPISRKLLADFQTTHPAPGIADMKKAAEPYGATAFYESQVIPYGVGGDYRLQVLKDGKENFKQDTQAGYMNGPPTGTDSFASGWQLMSGELLKPFMLPGKSLVVGADGALPIVAPYSAVEQLLGMQPLGGNASSSKKLERLKELRSKAESVTFSVCYRNKTSAASVDTANQLQQEILNNKSNKNYQKPSLITDLPDAACGAVRTTRDVRTKEEKDAAAKQEQFRRTFGEEPAATQVVNFKVVGVAPDPPDFAASGVSQLFSSILSSNVGSGWFTPLELKANLPILQKVFAPDPLSVGSNIIYAELPSDSKATAFLDEKNCQPDFAAMQAPAGSVAPDPFESCIAAGKPFMLSAFGSSSLAIASIRDSFNKFFKIAAVVVAVIAAVVMMGTLGRIIADSRRETAVFRAIGAKKLDIAQIYLTYVFLLATLVAVMSVAVGFILASIADTQWSSELTVKALVAYNAQDLDKQIHLYGFELKDMLYLVGFTFLAGLISAVLPLASNLRRNPIRDMRDEN